MSWLGRNLGSWVGAWFGYIADVLSGKHVDIVASVIATLESQGAWIRVVESRVPLRRQDYPYLRVYADWSRHPKMLGLHDPVALDRSVVIRVVGMLRLSGTGDTVTVEDEMDELAAEIETALTTSRLRGNLVGFTSLNLFETKTRVKADDDRISHAEVSTYWRVTYAEQEGIPGILI